MARMPPGESRVVKTSIFIKTAAITLRRDGMNWFAPCGCGSIQTALKKTPPAACPRTGLAAGAEFDSASGQLLAARRRAARTAGASWAAATRTAGASGPALATGSTRPTGSTRSTESTGSTESTRTTGSTESARPPTTAEAAAAATAHALRRAEQVLRGQVGAAVLEQCLQGGGSVGDFIRVNHTVVIGVQRKEDGRPGAARARPTPKARAALRSEAWPAGGGTTKGLRDGHPR